jgi:hypothetical protein
MYLGEELRAQIPNLILNSIFTQLLTLNNYSRPPIFYQALLHTLISLTKESTLFKGFQVQAESSMALIFSKISSLDNELKQRFISLISLYMS